MSYRKLLIACCLTFCLAWGGMNSLMAQDLQSTNGNLLIDQQHDQTTGLHQSEPNLFGSFGPLMNFNNVPTLTEKQSWQPFDNPNPEINFNIWGGANYAGDVTGNGQTDLVISAEARDERTGNLEDRVGKTAIFEGDNYTSTHDHLIYEAVSPVGDLNGNGHNDAMVTDDDRQEVTFYTGSADGYVETGITHSIETGALVRSYDDVDGSGYEDIVSMNQNSLDVYLLFGSDDLNDVGETTIGTEYPVFSVALVDVMDDGTSEVAVLTRENNEYDVLTVYQVDDNGEYEQHQQVAFEQKFESFPNMVATDFTGNDVPELLITDDTDDAHIVPINQDMGGFDPGAMIQTTSARPIGDIDDSGRTDMLFKDGDEFHIAYGSDDLSDWEGDLPQDETLNFPVDNVSISGPTYPGVVGYGDISGNSIDDYVFTYVEDENRGRVYLIGDENQDYDFEVMSVDIDTYSGEQVFGTESLGDINDNGYDDVAFLHTTEGKERVAIYYGGETMSDSPDLELESPFRPVRAIETGDFNGDGEQDLAFAVTRDRLNIEEDDPLNGIHIYYGSDVTGVDLETENADRIILFDELEDNVTSNASITNIENIGDLNSNGADDLLYSTPSANNEDDGLSDRIFITHGGSSMSTEPDIRIPEYSGTRLTALGDINGDGSPDFALSDFLLGDHDDVLVFFGDENADYSEPDLILEHDYDYDTVTAFGIGLTAGDLNGNGVKDIVAKPYHVGEEGRNPEIHVYFGGEDLDEQPDQVIELPDEVLFAGDAEDDFNSLGSLEVVPDLFGENVGGLLYASSGAPMTNAVVMQVDEYDSKPKQQYVLEAPNQDAALGGWNNYINIQASNAIGNFTDESGYEAILTQVNDGNDMLHSSRVYRYSAPEALILDDVADRTEDHGGWVVLEYSGALIEAKQNGKKLFSELDIQRKDDGEWISTGKVVKYDEELADRIEVQVPVTKPTGEDPSDENTFTFRITAYDADSRIIARSNTESGYAKDNIPPGEVAGFTADEQEGEIVFSWEPLDDPNMDGYLLFEVDENGEIDKENPETFTTETQLVMDMPEDGDPEYVVAGLDQHNNIGEPSQQLSVPTSSSAESDLPDEFALNENYPNPFNPDTQIGYDLPEDSRVTLEIYNVLGQHVQTLVNEAQSAGSYEVRFDASNLSSGTYIYRIEAGNFVDSRQMLLVK